MSYYHTIPFDGTFADAHAPVVIHDDRALKQLRDSAPYAVVVKMTKFRALEDVTNQVTRVLRKPKRRGLATLEEVDQYIEQQDTQIARLEGEVADVKGELRKQAANHRKEMDDQAANHRQEMDDQAANHRKEMDDQAANHRKEMDDLRTQNGVLSKTMEDLSQQVKVMLDAKEAKKRKINEVNNTPARQ
eukprot:TRINITY_DN2206_c0_g1_i1.p1 TRINITY_DN2206_c0_g1~~TRINITY_DN2206_c0_g1_i1.p1  ORF type:complete len:189 (+),score=42.17 TRINITY_DN2206_c0_g1_i1:369-935(+)